MSDGKGCLCAARSSADCACPDVDWTPRELVEVRKELAELRQENENLKCSRNLHKRSADEIAKVQIEYELKCKALEHQSAELQIRLKDAKWILCVWWAIFTVHVLNLHTNDWRFYFMGIGFAILSESVYRK